jgi:hypothetical protein
MKALPTDRHRAFVRALYQVKPGHGANVKAARLAAFGTPNSSPQSMATIASRLARDERVLAAIREEDEKRIRSSAPRAIAALSALIENPNQKTMPAESRWSSIAFIPSKRPISSKSNTMQRQISKRQRRCSPALPSSPRNSA